MPGRALGQALYKRMICRCGRPTRRGRNCVNCNTCRRSSKDLKIIALRQRCIDSLGGRCVQCGETRLGCLDIDHVDVDGRGHRAELKRQKYKNLNGNYQIYFWLIDRNFISNYRLQLLCRNCHGRKHGFYGWDRRRR